MPALFIRYASFFLLLLGSAGTVADEVSDPFDTQALLPLKPALRLQGAEGDPCEEALIKHPLNLFDVVNLALCNNPQTREVWASARVQAAQVGVNKAAYLPNLTLNAGLSRNWPANGTAYNQRNIGLSLSYLLYDFGARSANLESAKQLLSAAGHSQDSLVQTIFLAAVQSYYQTQSSFAALSAAKLDCVW
jgi:outer membrane protein